MGNISNREYFDCDLCGTKCKKISTTVQDGLRRCKKCVDEKIKTKPLKWTWGSGRPNPATTTAVSSPTVFTISASGITPSHSQASEKTYNGQLGISNAPDAVQFGSYYYMKVIGGGAITADPQISDGTKGDRICLEGTSDVHTVTLSDGTGLSLANGESFVLGNGDKIILAFNGDEWVEVSRFNEN
jgi:hypothetical protein